MLTLLMVSAGAAVALMALLPMPYEMIRWKEQLFGVFLPLWFACFLVGGTLMLLWYAFHWMLGTLH